VKALSATEHVRQIVLPIIEGSDASLYDIEHESGILRIMIDRPDGIDVDTIGDLSQQISDALDADDPFPNQRYLLEVTSPGVERKLRTPEHFAAQLGSDINVKVHRSIEGNRRFEARLDTADEKGIGITILGLSDEIEAQHRIDYEDIDTARVVFRWEDLTDSPGKSKQPNKSTNKKASKR
jgi:ribosome maturation factor RimP